MRLQEYVKDLESHGLTIKHVNHFWYSWLSARWVDNYTEFLDILARAKMLYLLSFGLILFPRCRVHCLGLSEEPRELNAERARAE